jgi:hypothetical protein
MFYSCSLERVDVAAGARHHSAIIRQSYFWFSPSIGGVG